MPELSLSPRYREMLKDAKSDPNIYEYLRRKIEADNRNPTLIQTVRGVGFLLKAGAIKEPAD